MRKIVKLDDMPRHLLALLLLDHESTGAAGDYGRWTNRTDDRCESETFYGASFGRRNPRRCERCAGHDGPHVSRGSGGYRRWRWDGEQSCIEPRWPNSFVLWRDDSAGVNRR